MNFSPDYTIIVVIGDQCVLINYSHESPSFYNKKQHSHALCQILWALIQKYSNVQFKKTEVKNDPNLERVGKQVEQYLVDCEKYNTDNTAV